MKEELQKVTDFCLFLNNYDLEKTTFYKYLFAHLLHKDNRKDDF